MFEARGVTNFGTRYYNHFTAHMVVEAEWKYLDVNANT